MRTQLSQTLKRASLLSGSLLLLLQMMVPITAAAAQTTASDWYICHANGGSGNYSKVPTDFAGAFNGHLDDDFGGTHGNHQNGNDIIPPFTYQGNAYSQNWDTAGQTIWANGCSDGPQACFAQVPWWKVGKVYAEDVYTRSYKYKYWKYIDRRNDGQPAQWVLQDIVTLSQQKNDGKDSNPSHGDTWYEFVSYVYTKIHDKGDQHPTLYGPYKLMQNPLTVAFNVGSGNHKVGDLFNYNETNYNDNNDRPGEKDGEIDYEYIVVASGTEYGTERIPCDKPADKVEYTEWVDGAPNCDTKTVTPVRTKTVTPYVLAQDGYTWVPGMPVVTEEYDQPRSLTSDELKNCTQQPDDKVTYSQWQDEQWACGDTTTIQKRTKTVTPYVWDGDSWELDETNASVTIETQPRDLDEAEIFPCPPETACNLLPILYRTTNLALLDDINPNALDTDCYVGGYKYNDVNGDGEWDEETEETLAGFTFELYSCSNSVLGVDAYEAAQCEDQTFLETTVSDENGFYAFTITDNGTYMVCETPRDGWLQTSPVDSENTPACWMVTIVNDYCDILHFGNKAKEPGEVLGEPTPEPPVLVNTGASALLGMIVGLSIIGFAAGAVTLNRKS